MPTDAVIHRVEALLADPEALVMVFDPSGASVLDVPEGLDCRARVLTDIDSPMEPLATESQGRAVSLYELARRNGSSEGAVTLADGETHAVLYLFDLSEQFGVFLAAMLESSAHERAIGDGLIFSPRQIVYRMSPTGVILAVDDAFTRALGWTAEEMVGTSSLDITHPDEHERGIVNWAELLDNPGGARRIRVRLKHKDGSWSWFESTTQNLLGDPNEECVVCESVDISDEMEAISALHHREALLARLTEALPTGVLHLDPQSEVLFSNARWFEITGLDDGSGFADFTAILEDPESVVDAISLALEDAVDVDLNVTISRGDDDLSYARLSMRPLDRGDSGDGILLALEDTTEATALHDQLAHWAQRDPLTGVLNRRGVLNRLESVLAESHQSASAMAVLYLDLDGFKRINDMHTHSMGDQVLCAVAERLTHFLRPGDHVGRIGGDEFLMILSEVNRPDDAYSIAARLERAVGTISESLANQIEVAVSVGVALARPYEDCESLIKRADRSMYQRKSEKAAARSN